MQLFLVLGILFAIGAVSFAFQNDVPVTVTLSYWRFDSSLPVVLLVALGLEPQVGLMSKIRSDDQDKPKDGANAARVVQHARRC